MKAITLLPIIAAAILLFPSEGKAQNQASQENQTVNAIKIKSLKNRQAALKQQIAIEDNKRNAVIEGVSAETLEQRNARQDSICLELRSELVDVELELSELEGDPQAAQIAQQYNQLVNANRPDSAQAAPPAKPSKPATPAKPSKPAKKS